MRILICILFLSAKLVSQNDTIMGTLILSDSLYHTQSTARYSFQKNVSGFGRPVEIDDVKNINDYVKIKNNQLTVKIMHGGGCETVTAKLVYDGLEHKDDKGNKHYILKLLFLSNDACQALLTKGLIFDISSISGHKIKLYGFNHFLN